MKIRIIAGKKIVSQFENSSKLKILYQSNNLLIQGDSDVKIIKKNNKEHCFFIGQLIGIRSSNDQLESIEINNIKSKNYLSNHSIEKCVNLLEGRFIILQINTDGNFEVSCDLFNQIDLYYQNFKEGVILASDLD